MPDLTSRIRGALLGLAVGDALGAASIRDLHSTFTGKWTDHTGISLCLAQSLIETSGFYPLDQMRRYLRLHRLGEPRVLAGGSPSTLGEATRRALYQFEFGSMFRTESFSDHDALARVAPTACVYCDMPRMAIEMCGNASRTTHTDPVDIDCCRYLGALIVGALTGKNKGQLLDDQYAADCFPLGKKLEPIVELIAFGAYRNFSTTPQTIHSIDTLKAALSVFEITHTFKDGALLASSMGDVVSAVYGQLAGAFYSVEDIPREWLDHLAGYELLDDVAHLIAQIAERRALTVSVPSVRCHYAT